MISDYREIEKDSTDSESIENLFAFLHPPQELLSTLRSFGLHYDRNVFDCWVKQPSPCCAAAAVAGAYNCLSNLPRSDPRCLSHEDVLDIFRELLLEMIKKKTASFERMLGASFMPILTLVERELSRYTY
jgi:hypothetical protein